MNAFRRILLIAFVQLLLSQGYAQHFPSKQYMTADGMPTNSVFDIAQHHSGMMWFMTKAGPTLYDAKNWITFSDSLELPSSFNSKVFISGDSVWVAGINKKRFTINYFHNGAWNYIDPPSGPILLGSHLDFHISGSGKKSEIFVCQASNIYHYRPTEEKWTQQKITGAAILSIHEIDGSVLTCTSKGVYQWSGEEFVPFPLPYQDLPNKNTLTLAIREDLLHLLGNNWYAEIANDSVQLLMQDVGISRLSQFTQSSLLIANDELILYSSGSPARIIDNNRMTWKNLLIQGKNLDIGSTCIFQDIENNIWVSDSRGLFKFNVSQFINYNGSSGLTSNEVSSIFQLKDGSMLLANPWALNHIKEDAIEHYLLGTAPGINFRILDIEKHGKKIYMAANDGGLLVYDPDRLETPERILYGPNVAITSCAVYNGKLYVSGNKGLFEVQDGTFKQKSTFGAIRNMVVIDDQLLLLTFAQGLFFFDGQELKQYKSEDFDLNSGYQAAVFNDQLVIGTRNGLATISNEKIQPWDELSLYSPVYGLLVDSKNRMWIGTDHGIYVYESGTLSLYDIDDGLSGNEANRNAIIEDDKGWIWIGTEKGVSVFRGNKQITGIVNQEVILHSIQSANGKQLTKEENILPFDENSILVSFSCLSYIDEEKIDFRCRLNQDESWIELSTGTTSVSFPNINYGTYTFEIQSRFDEEEWGDSSTFEFIVSKPYYFQWWFILASVLSIIILVRVFFYFRYLVLLRTKEKLKKEVQLRTKEITELNLHLEEKVKERTSELNTKNKRLEEYAYINAHHLRGPATKIMSALAAAELDGISNKEMIAILNESVQELDKVIISINDTLHK
ncbi:MAG: hypothetical protein HRT61_06010 [Ekhidna sp.]|nr:hypothetical protein [Ekhidna sp.]